MRFQQFDEALELYATLAANNNFKAVLSYAPAAHVAYGKSASFLAPELKELMTWYSNEQRTYLAKKCVELGILFVDLTPALQSRIDELGGSKLLYFPSNIHFTILGHQVVAQEVRRALAGAGLLTAN
jgi:lysophospholipase L1-like esterase